MGEMSPPPVQVVRSRKNSEDENKFYRAIPIQTQTCTDDLGIGELDEFLFKKEVKPKVFLPPFRIMNS